ncbi:MAG: hypothetical protein CME16_00205 [Gemmatimonadetes bacterium]|nr:hypothetical protein [Gemmatimonadota bacterium]
MNHHRAQSARPVLFTHQGRTHCTHPLLHVINHYPGFYHLPLAQGFTTIRIQYFLIFGKDHKGHALPYSFVKADVQHQSGIVNQCSYFPVDDFLHIPPVLKSRPTDFAGRLEFKKIVV